ncbi:response regulator transcription factor [Alteromonas mediterranea]|uniref:response regulator transcription factor n=1 Tax=Alteromonas mediterranea TaxID=314275 RepID=UPI002FE336E7
MENEKINVLLVDDDVDLCALLSSNQYDTVVLDIMMPGMSGLDVLRAVRAEKQTPILMLTGRGDDIDRIVGLEMGADDYLPKPCNPRELGARTASVEGRPISLTGAEFNALCLLMERAGQTISKQEMTQEVLSRPLEAYDRAMDVHISRIRQKLSAVGVNNVIKSIRKVGYQMLTSPQSQK